MRFTISDIFFSIVIFQLLFLSFFLFTQEKGRRIPAILLGSFFLSICLNLIDVFLLMKKWYFSYPSWAGWGNCLPLLFGPLLYLYTCSLLVTGFEVGRDQWRHFLPFLIFFLFTEIYWLPKPNIQKQLILNHILERDIPVSVYIVSSLIFLQFLIYIFACIRLIGRYRRQVGEKFSDFQRVDTSWIYSAIIFFTVLMSFSMLNGYLGLTSWSRYYYLAFTILILAMMVFVNRVMLTAMRKPGFFTIEPGNRGSDVPATTPKYAGSVLTEADKQKIAGQVQKYMSEQRPFLEPELTLEQLAAKLSLRPKLLSQVLNETIGQNFFDFVNGHRIEEAKRLLTNPADKKITVLEVLYEVGFNSKSSFNTLFKKQTGLTPSEFKKRSLGL